MFPPSSQTTVEPGTSPSEKYYFWSSSLVTSGKHVLFRLLVNPRNSTG
jgi:hypothetical protein